LQASSLEGFGIEMTRTALPRLNFGLVFASLAISAVIVASVGCGTIQGASRAYVYAPTFNYITDEQLQSSMWQLAAGVESLEARLAPSVAPSKMQQADVIRTLTQMDAAAARLGPEGWPSNHPRITQRLGWFRDRVASAKRAAEVDPPSYFLAGSLSGACYACHGSQSEAP
jgi:hypothetical protein